MIVIAVVLIITIVLFLHYNDYILLKSTLFFSVLVKESYSSSIMLSFLAYNGHTDCIRTILQNSNMSEVIHALDSQERFVQT